MNYKVDLTKKSSVNTRKVVLQNIWDGQIIGNKDVRIHKFVSDIIVGLLVKENSK